MHTGNAYYCATGSTQSHNGSSSSSSLSSLVVTLFDERDHPGQCAPVVELRARAIPASARRPAVERCPGLRRRAPAPRGPRPRGQRRRQVRLGRGDPPHQRGGHARRPPRPLPGPGRPLLHSGQGSVKRGYYGLAFLVVERVGIDRLHELCLEASAQGFRKLPRSWVLREAELGEDISEWRKAAAQAMGEAELRELIRMYPASIANALAHHLRSKPGTPEQRWEAVEGSVRLGEGTAELALEDLAFLRAEVLARL